MGRKEGGSGHLVVLHVFLYRISKLSPVLYRTTNLHVSFSRKITIGKESTYLSPNEKRIKL